MSEWWMEHKDFLIHLDEKINSLTTPEIKENEERYQALIRELYDDAVKLAEITNTEEKFEEVDDIMTHPIMDWLLDLPYNLAKYEYVDEAVQLGRKWSTITDPENFLGDAVVILSEAGRKEQTLDLIAELKKDYFYDIWVQIKTGDAYAALKDLTNAELIYKKALESAQIKYDQEGILERLVPMLSEQGRKDEADEIESWFRKKEPAGGNAERYIINP